MSLSKPGQMFIVFLSLTIPSVGATQDAVIFSENFETGWGLWSADNGVWEVGTPVPGPEGTPEAGPGNCHQGSQCAGTGLDGIPPGLADSHLISPSIRLPDVTDDQEIHVRIWQWFSYDTHIGIRGGDYCDFGKVEVAVYDESGAWSEWMFVGNVIKFSSTWSPVSIDLTPYAGSKIRVGFRHLATDQVDAVYDHSQQRLTIVQQKGKPASFAALAATVALLASTGDAVSDDIDALVMGTVQDLDNHEVTQSR